MRIRSEVNNELVIKKSRFICYLQRVDNEQQAKDYIKKIKKLHPKANHHCQAFIIDHDLQRSNDDHEPSGTAGIPMLEVLRHRELDKICAVVVRYFGGILLGGGGLIKAYSQSVVEALNKATLYQCIEYDRYQIIFDYPFIDRIDYLLKDETIEKRDYQTQVTYQFLCNNEQIIDQLSELTNGTIVIEKLNQTVVENIVNTV